MRPVGISALLAGAIVIGMAAPAHADIVKNDVTSTVGGDKTVTTPVNVGVDVGFDLHKTGKDCDATAAKPVLVTVEAPGLWLPSEPLRFTGCDTGNQTVRFGSNYPGTFEVSLTSTNLEVNTDPARFTLVVTAPTPPADKPPVFTSMPVIGAVEATGPDGAVVYWDLPTVTDDFDPSPNVACSFPSGITYPLGFKQVGCTAEDNAGKLSHNHFSFTVVDTTAPVISGMPENKTVEADGADAIVNWDLPTATDVVDGSVDVTCTPMSGSRLAVGDHTITCSATDSRGNTATSESSVKVADWAGPIFDGRPVPMTFEATGPNGADVSYAIPTANDAVSGPAPVTCSPAPGSRLPLGDNTVICEARDAHNNPAVWVFTASVVDTQAPTLTVPSNLAVVAAVDANGAIVTFDAPTATDIADAKPTITCSHASGASFALGQTTVNCTATDKTGNKVDKSFTVTVTAPILESIAIAKSPDAVRPSYTSMTQQVGLSKDLDVIGRYSNGIDKVLTNNVTWTSTNSSIATVSDTGNVTGLAVGNVTITAVSGGFSKTFEVKIIPNISSLTISGAPAALAKGVTAPLTATATLNAPATGTANVSATATWQSSNPAIATVSASGLVKATGIGSATITATYQGVIASVTINTTAPTMTGLTVTPATSTLKRFGSMDLKAIATYSDGTTADVTATAKWTSSNTSIATVLSSGRVQSSYASGTVKITATYNGLTSSANLTIV